jgi:hypothetical protein
LLTLSPPSDPQPAHKAQKPAPDPQPPDTSKPDSRAFSPTALAALLVGRIDDWLHGSDSFRRSTAMSDFPHRARGELHDFLFDCKLAVSGLCKRFRCHRSKHDHEIASSEIVRTERVDRIGEQIDRIDAGL